MLSLPHRFMGGILSRTTAWKTGLISFVPVVVFLTLFPLRQEKMQRAHDIHGISFVAPRRAIGAEAMEPIRKVNANWVAIIPYAFCRPGQPQIVLDQIGQWWGERPAGVIKLIEYAQGLGLKVMVKPQIWVAGEGWPGDFELTDPGDWEIWEEEYRRYLMTYVRIADSMNVEMICIGTEFRQAVTKRPQFWKNLIKEIRSRYGGQLTYAANWDNFEAVTFWQQLDFVGIDAYFPLSGGTTPTTQELVSAWKTHLDQIETLSLEVDRKVIFTEYGYRSVDRTAMRPWEVDQDQLATNLPGQRNGYMAMYQAVSQRDWFVGGFLWKWFADNQAGGSTDQGFTPQNKPAAEVVRRQFSLKKR